MKNIVILYHDLTSYLNFSILDLSDTTLDEEVKENTSPNELPDIVPIDSFGKSFEEAVSGSACFWKPFYSLVFFRSEFCLALHVLAEKQEELRNIIN